MSLSIRRLRNVFLAGKDLPCPETVCAGLESSVRRAGVDRLAQALDEVLDPADPSVWVIRRLRVSFAIGEPRRGDETWARGVASGICKLMERGADGENAMRFPDRASYWAWFLRDLASGNASQWWYEPLAGLRALEYGAACVTLLSREPELTVPVLTQLDEWSVWEQASPRIAESHASQLLDWISTAQDAPAAELLEAAVAVWMEAGAEALDAPRARLRLAIALLRDFDADVAAQIRGAVELLAQAESALTSLTTSERAKFAEAAERGPISLDDFEDSVAARLDLPVRLLPPRVLQPLTRAIESRQRPEQISDYTGLTVFGGWYLLLSSYLSLEIEELVAEEHRPALRWLLARMCLGPRGRIAPENDPGLLWASGLERAPQRDEFPWPEPGRIALWQSEHRILTESDPDYFGGGEVEAVWQPVAAAIVRKFAARLPGFAKASPAHLDANIFDGRTALRFSPGAVDVWIARRPLDILLRLAGYAGASFTLPWKDYATITIRLD